MFTLITMEHSESAQQIRSGLTLPQAYTIASKGGFYKSQIISEFGVIEYEF